MTYVSKKIYIFTKNINHLKHVRYEKSIHFLVDRYSFNVDGCKH